MKIKFYYCIAIVFASIAVNKTTAQDIHFSQSTMIPLVLNPALTGGEGDQRAFLNYKNQWRGLSTNGATFTTAFFSVDGSFYKKRWERGYIGAGLTGFKDVAGDLKMGTTQINLSFAGVVRVADGHSLSGGLQGGYVQKSISTAGMQWESQYDSGLGGFNSNIAANDIAILPPSKFVNFSGGLAWNYGKKSRSIGSNNQVKATAGISLQNINAPNQDFTNIVTDRLYRNFVIHANAEIGVTNTDLAIIPSVVYYNQGPSTEINIGSLFRYTIKERSKYTGVYKGTTAALGAYYRLNDAIVPTLLIEYSNYSFGLSYDVNISGLTAASRGRGGFEISLKYVNPNPFYSAPRLRD